jgi:phage portal protein BeeE
MKSVSDVPAHRGHAVGYKAGKRFSGQTLARSAGLEYTQMYHSARAQDQQRGKQYGNYI